MWSIRYTKGQYEDMTNDEEDEMELADMMIGKHLCCEVERIMNLKSPWPSAKRYE